MISIELEIELVAAMINYAELGLAWEHSLTRSYVLMQAQLAGIALGWYLESLNTACGGILWEGMSYD